MRDFVYDYRAGIENLIRQL